MRLAAVLSLLVVANRAEGRRPVVPNECKVTNEAWLGDGYCDDGGYNTAGCGFDGGDCCEATCKPANYDCGYNEYNCKDPANQPPTDAPADAMAAYVALHNAKRQLHVDTPDLVYDAVLAEQAQQYADTCPTGHADNNSDGENLSWRGLSVGPVAIDYGRAVGSWYDEIEHYLWPRTPYGQQTEGYAVGHFTQIVWKSTTRVGCGARSNCDNKFQGYVNNVIVCRYAPAGNMMGQAHLQVGPLKNDVSVETE